MPKKRITPHVPKYPKAAERVLISKYTKESRQINALALFSINKVELKNYH
jgi:hypothetical protein